MNKVAVAEFTNYKESVKDALDKIDAAKILGEQEKIIIKPNLVSCGEPPVTTDVNHVKAIISYIKKCSKAKIYVADGSGGCDTDKAFKNLGYDSVEPDATLVDIDKEESIIKLSKDLPLLKEVFLPSFLMDGFLISAPSLKQHTITKVTLGIKNMIGILPRKHYQGYWVFRKSKIHKYNIHQAIADVACYRKTDLTIIDGAIGLSKGHLFGKPFNPPKKKTIAGFDPLETDCVGAEMLGYKPMEVKHLRCYKSNLKKAGL